MPGIKKIHHVAIVVEEIKDSLTFWRDALGLELGEMMDVPNEKSVVAFLPLAGCEIELVQPTSADSGIGKYLSKRGPGMHHVCLAVDDLDALLDKLKNQGIRLINEEPRESGDGKRYAFVHPESTGGVLVELYEE